MILTIAHWIFAIMFTYMVLIFIFGTILTEYSRTLREQAQDTIRETWHFTSVTAGILLLGSLAVIVVFSYLNLRI